MRCDEFERQWNAALDDREAPQQISALTAHAALCPHCAALLNTSDLLARAFPTREAVAPSSGWREATVRACVVERALQGLDAASAEHAVPMASAAPTKSNRPWYAAVAVAAGLLVAIFALQNRNRPGNDNQPQPQPEQIVNKPAVRVISPDLDKTRHGNPLAPATETTLALPNLNRAQLSWVGYQVSDGLRPVTMGVSNAWQSLKRPLHKSEMEPEMPLPQENGRSSFWAINRECYV